MFIYNVLDHVVRIVPEMSPVGGDWSILKVYKCISTHTFLVLSGIIAELAKRSPITIQNSSNPSSRKNLVVRPYDRTSVQGATFSMRGQLYHGHYLSHYVMEGRGRR